MNRNTSLLVTTLVFAIGISEKTFSQNPLFIPDTLSGKVFNLTVQKSSKVFFTGYTTTTYGFNGPFLGTTLFMNKGDSVTLNVINTLLEATTVHWHGFHIPSKYDGGPHQVINAGTTWSPSFKIRNNAGTYWYHPHGHRKTEIQVSKGLAGLIIIRDSAEASYTLPRKYKVDDFPLIVQARIFDDFKQIATATHDDSIVMVNGTINPFLQVPKQVVRFRILNGSPERTYNFGLSDSSYFYLIATDGGLLEQPYKTKRLRLSVGERAEILIDFGKDTIGQQKYLMSYSSELPKGIIGADSVGTKTLIIQDGYYQNKLNGLDFKLLRFDVITTTTTTIPVTTIPTSFAPITYIPPSQATVTRHLNFTPDLKTSGQQGFVDGPFFINMKTFNMDSINQVVFLDNTEIWELTNKTLVAHPFHIHDIQFFVLDINRKPPPPELSGYKDVILVQPDDTVRFITKFDLFSDEVVPFMYHCHLLHHEDDGMMGSFLVVDTTGKSGISENDLLCNMKVYQDFSNNELSIKLSSKKNTASRIIIIDMLGRKQKNIFSGTIYQGENELKANISDLKKGIYFVVLSGEIYQCKKIIR